MTASPSFRRPVTALLLLAPVVAEVLFGATRLTTVFVLPVQIGAWGCGALLVREVACRRRLNPAGIWLLALALALAEECLIQQTSFWPLVGADLHHLYGRAGGVNWVYLLWALGYESIWAVVIPIQLAELLYPQHRDVPWLGRRGLMIAAIAFIVAALAAWFSWTRVFVPKYFPGGVYEVPRDAFFGAGLVLIALVTVGIKSSRSPAPSKRRLPPPRPLAVLGVAFALALPWFGLVFLAYGARPELPPAIALAGGLILAAGAGVVFGKWSRRDGWADRQRLAAGGGALGASMLVGFAILKLGQAGRIDVVGKLILNLIAVACLIRVARRLPGQTHAVPPPAVR